MDGILGESQETSKYNNLETVMIKIYQVPVTNETTTPVLVATSLEQFLALLNEEMLDVANHYFQLEGEHDERQQTQ